MSWFLLRRSTFALDRNTRLASTPGVLVEKCVCVVGGSYQGVLGLGNWRVKINWKREPDAQGKLFFPPSLTSP